MKNITVSVDDETYRCVRIKAAKQSTSVSALVKQFLIDFAADKSEAEKLKREERSLRAQIHSFRAGDRLTREALHAH